VEIVKLQLDHVLALRTASVFLPGRFCILERAAARSLNFNYAPEHHLQFLLWISLCGVF
jgi:hypothetical protein